MRVLIFTEGGSQIGLGHISRCSSLYDELDSREIEVELIINGDPNIIDNIQNKNVKIINWLSAEYLNHYIKENDYSIVDSYLADEDLNRVISKQSKKCLFIDDNARIRYPMGIIVNPALNTESVKYPISDENCYLLGPEYIILRRPFVKSKRTTINTKVKEVLITLGGSDIRNLIPMILNQLCSRNPDMIYNVVIGNAFKNIDEITRIQSNNINLYQNVDAEEMRRIMLKSDVAITAAGQTIYELLATQTPFIPIKIIENQNNNIVGLKKLDLVDIILDYEDTFFLDKLEIEFNKLLGHSERYEIFNLYGDVIDGLGSKRIIDRLMDN